MMGWVLGILGSGNNHFKDPLVLLLIADLVISPLLINLRQQLLRTPTDFLEVAWEVPQMSVMVLFAWRQIHSWRKIHDELMRAKGGESHRESGLNLCFPCIPPHGEAGKVWSHFCGCATTHVFKRQRAEMWNYSAKCSAGFRWWSINVKNS